MPEQTSDAHVAALLTACLDELAIRRPPGDLFYCSSSQAGQPVSRSRPVPTHVAMHAELLLVRSGSLQVATPTEVPVLVPGRLLVIDRGVEHGEVHEGEYDAIFFTPYGTNVQVSRICSDGTELQMHLLGRTDLGHIRDIICEELAGREPGFEWAVQSLLGYIACVLARRVQRHSYLWYVYASSDTRSSTDQRALGAIHHAMGYLAQHLAEHIDVEDVARVTNYSPGHLNRFFLRCCGQTVAKCLRDLRMARAQDLLRHSELSVAQIAERVGYSDRSSFRRAFRAATGVSLRAYRHSA